MFDTQVVYLSCFCFLSGVLECFSVGWYFSVHIIMGQILVIYFKKKIPHDIIKDLINFMYYFFSGGSERSTSLQLLASCSSVLKLRPTEHFWRIGDVWSQQQHLPEIQSLLETTWRVLTFFSCLVADVWNASASLHWVVFVFSFTTSTFKSTGLFPFPFLQTNMWTEWNLSNGSSQYCLILSFFPLHFIVLLWKLGDPAVVWQSPSCLKCLSSSLCCNVKHRFLV